MDELHIHEILLAEIDKWWPYSPPRTPQTDSDLCRLLDTVDLRGPGPVTDWRHRIPDALVEVWPYISTQARLVAFLYASAMGDRYARFPEPPKGGTT